MSRYKVGDKVVVEIEKAALTDNGGGFYIVLDYMQSAISVDEKSEPLSTYTEPLERKNENKQKQIEKLVDKLHRQAAEITRLLAENKELKEDFEKSKIVNLNAGRLAGQNEAWELAQKIFRGAHNNGYSPKELAQIFGCEVSKPCILENTYPEAAAKVAEWEKAKEKIKVGDVLEGIYDNEVKCIVTNLCPDNMAYLVFDDGTAGVYELDNLKKTGRHIDIDSFLKQIGEE